MSPTPKKSDRRRRGGQQRHASAGAPNDTGDDSQERDLDAEDGALMELLGVSSTPSSSTAKDTTSTHTPGILQISKSDMQGTPRTRSRTKKAEKAQATSGSSPLGKQDGNAESESKKRSKKKPKSKADEASGPVSALTASRPAQSSKQPKAKNQQPKQSQSAFETASLSQSLPTDSVFAAAQAKKGRADPSAVWDMPDSQGLVEDLTVSRGLFVSSMPSLTVSGSRSYRLPQWRHLDAPTGLRLMAPIRRKGQVLRNMAYPPLFPPLSDRCMLATYLKTVSPTLHSTTISRSTQASMFTEPLKLQPNFPHLSHRAHPYLSSPASFLALANRNSGA